MNENFKNQLYEIAERRIRLFNYRFDVSSSIELRTFINRGVDRMLPSEILDDSKRKLVENNLMKLIDSMASEGKRRNLSESIDTKAFSDARFSICPLWPFC